PRERRAPESARPPSPCLIEESGARSFSLPFCGPSSDPGPTHARIRGADYSPVSLKHLLSEFRSQNRANQLRLAGILISPAKHSRERPRVLESSSLQNPLYKRVCVTAICQDNFRSEEHTSELQSRSDLVCRLLLEKKKTHSIHTAKPTTTLVETDERM